jgi:hypothetical protein
VVHVSKSIRSLARSFWFACFLLIQVAGVTQLYPFVHLHHVHDENGARLVLSIHPPSVDDIHVDATSEEEHHHDADHVALDCNLCQRLLSQLQRQADVVVFSTVTFDDLSQIVLVHHTSDPPPLQKTQSVLPPDFRGPPAIV